MPSVLPALTQSAVDRAEQWKPEFVRSLPEVETLQEIAMLGAHSFSLPQTRRRLIKTTITLQDEIRETPSAVARDYIRMIYKRGPKGTHRQLEKVANIPPVPSYARPRQFLHGLYIDIKSCYWSVMNIIGWDVDYNPGLWLSPGRPPHDWPFPEHKVARNCLVSAGRMSTIPMYDPRKLPGDPFGEVKRGSPIKNLQLPRLIHDLLNCIADDAISLGAIYVNTDGMIAPDLESAEAITNMIADWGLTARVKAEGLGEVRAAGTYTVGSEKTLNFHKVKDERPINNIYAPDYKRWLQREFGFFAAKKKP